MPSEPVPCSWWSGAVSLEWSLAPLDCSYTHILPRQWFLIKESSLPCYSQFSSCLSTRFAFSQGTAFHGWDERSSRSHTTARILSYLEFLLPNKWIHYLRNESPKSPQGTERMQPDRLPEYNMVWEPVFLAVFVSLWNLISQAPWSTLPLIFWSPKLSVEWPDKLCP